MQRKASVLLVAIGMSLPSALALAQDEAPSELVIEEITCRDVLLQSGDEQDRTISFMHGYAAGTAGRTAVDVDALVTATSRFLEACIEDPDASAIGMLRDILD